MTEEGLIRFANYRQLEELEPVGLIPVKLALLLGPFKTGLWILLPLLLGALAFSWTRVHVTLTDQGFRMREVTRNERSRGYPEVLRLERIEANGARESSPPIEFIVTFLDGTKINISRAVESDPEILDPFFDEISRRTGKLPQAGPGTQKEY